MFQLPIYSLLVILIIGITAAVASSRREMVPGPLQNFVEVIVGGLSEFVEGILGLEGRPFVPYIGTLYLKNSISNQLGILPFVKAPTSSINTTSLALCTFLYVQFTAFRGQGPLGYLFHLAGEPRDPVGWAMVPLMLPLHIIGEFAKPLSLSLRLFGNIFGEETLVAVFVGMGVAILAATHLPIGLPIQTPFYFLALLTSTIQALVFSLLTTIYISLVLPHKHHDDHGHGHAGHGHGEHGQNKPAAAAAH
jgi:F-type H+-transporting ATPase subunit a